MRYAAAFLKANVGIPELPYLTEADLAELGVTVGHRKRLLRAIAALPLITSSNEGATPTATKTLARPEAERRHLTVLFCDLVGSTALSARLDVEDLSTVVGAYHRCCAEVIALAGGFVAQYSGDGVLAYFGYPHAHEDDPERAVRAGLALIKSIGELKSGSITLQARVGIATGLVVVGDLIGKGVALGQVVGETPNLAARLQSCAEPKRVIISASTRRLLGRLFEYRELDPVSLKGFAVPVPAWEVLGPSTEENRFEARQGGHILPLVGREGELDLLLRNWLEAKTGKARPILLTGEAGIGKSRIVRALQDRLIGEPHAEVRYFCSPHYNGSALHPVISQIENFAGFTRADSSEAKFLKLQNRLRHWGASEEEITLVANLLSLPPSEECPLSEMSPQRRKEKTFDALLAQTERIAAQQPVLVTFEDLHWIDPSSLELLTLAIERWSQHPILIVTTARPEFKPPWRGNAPFTSVVLARLAASEARMLVEQVADGKKLPVKMMEEIVARTDGIPLFVEELTKTVLEVGLPREQEGNLYLRERLLSPSAIPTTLHDSLMARLDRLAPVREIAQIGSALGRTFSYELLSAVVSLPEDQLNSALRDLVKSELVSCRGAPRGAIYTFKHALVRDVAYQSMLRSRRVQLHAHVGTLLENSFPELADAEPETLAQHFTAANLPDRAIHYWLAAGRRALQRCGHKEAIAHLYAGKALLPEVTEEAARGQLEIKLEAALGFALIEIKGYAAREVEVAFSRAYQLCQTIGETSLAIPILRGLATFQWAHGNLSGARSFSMRLIQIAKRKRDKELSLVAHGMLAGILNHMGDFSASEVHLKKLRVAYDLLQHQNIVARFGADTPSFTWVYHGYNLAWLGHLDTALATLQEAVESARRTGHRSSLTNALCRAAVCPVILHDPVMASSFAEQGLVIAQELGLPVWIAAATIVLGWAIALDSRSDEGINKIKGGITLWHSTGATSTLPLFYSLLSDAMLARGDFEGAISSADEGLRYSITNSEHGWDGLLHCSRGDALLRAGTKADAESAYLQAFAWSRDRSAKWGELDAAVRLARLWRSDCRADRAREVLIPICNWFSEGFNIGALKNARTLAGDLASVQE